MSPKFLEPAYIVKNCPCLGASEISFKSFYIRIDIIVIFIILWESLVYFEFSLTFDL